MHKTRAVSHLARSLAFRVACSAAGYFSTVAQPTQPAQPARAGHGRMPVHRSLDSHTTASQFTEGGKESLERARPSGRERRTGSLDRGAEERSPGRGLDCHADQNLTSANGKPVFWLPALLGDDDRRHFLFLSRTFSQRDSVFGHRLNFHLR